jgi:beta-mannosidase
MVTAPNMIDLAGRWTIYSVTGGHVAGYAVPGDVHSALHRAGIIPHPYRGRNEYDVRWVAEQQWSAKRTFDFQGAPGEWYLDIDYLDTVAEIHVNGQRVLMAENCFRRYRPDVTPHLRQGENEIQIVFHSNVTEAAERQKAQPFYVPYAKQNCPIPDGNMLRKPACHFGWDWNIAIAPFGIYGDIKLCRFDRVRVEHVQAFQTHRDDGSVDINVAVAIFARDVEEVNFSVSLGGQVLSSTITATVGKTWRSQLIAIPNPKLWWPAGLGDQFLYDLKVVCGTSQKTQRIGLRKIELLTDGDADGQGSRFAFRINGHETFCRGANWIPADALPSQATPELTRKLLQAAVDANMNMIRVWGGGYYEQDFFYDTCDELGLLVWQDFMFACNLYPSTPEFLAEVEREVDYQVRRLQHHACIALWCGDNELIGALTWFEESLNNRDRYLVSYDRLNRTIEIAAKAADPTINWWPSSPSPGPLSFGDAWHDDRSGDMHFWSVWHEGKNFEHYREVKPRFCSEFGFQSFPSLGIAKTFTGEADLNISSPVMESHQKNAGGNARIAETMFRYFRFPMTFSDFVYVSQIQHGLAMRTAVEYWRTLKPHCMGTLYWQLNDTWPVASWSGLDHGSGWKALHYMARRFFDSVAVFAVPSADGSEIVLSGVNDTRQATAIQLDCFALSVAGRRTELAKLTATVPIEKSIELMRIEAAKIPTDAILHFSVTRDGAEKVEAHLAPKPYKAYAFEDPAIAIQAKVDGSELLILLNAKKPAYFVSLESDEPGHFSDGAFDLLPDETKSIRFTPSQSGGETRATASLIVRNLHSATHS